MPQTKPIKVLFIIKKNEATKFAKFLDWLNNQKLRIKLLTRVDHEFEYGRFGPGITTIYFYEFSESFGVLWNTYWRCFNESSGIHPDQGGKMLFFRIISYSTDHYRQYIEQQIGKGGGLL